MSTHCKLRMFAQHHAHWNWIELNWIFFPSPSHLHIEWLLLKGLSIMKTNIKKRNIEHLCFLKLCAGMTNLRLCSLLRTFFIWHGKYEGSCKVRLCGVQIAKNNLRRVRRAVRSIWKRISLLSFFVRNSRWSKRGSCHWERGALCSIQKKTS